MGLEAASFISDLVTTNPVGATDLKAQGDDHLRLIKAAVKASFPGIVKATYLQIAAANVAAATTTDIGAATTDNVVITGSGITITSLGTVAAGTYKQCKFADVNTLTYSGTALILPSAANITTAANDRFGAISLGSGNWLVLWYVKADGKALVAPALTELGTISQLTALTAIALDDLLLVGDTSASNASKGITPVNLLKVLDLLTEDTSPDGAADFGLSFDTSAGTVKKVKPGNLTVASAALATLAPGSLLGLLEDRKTAGTAGGSSAAGAWTTRTLNTETYDRSSILSIASDQFTISTAGSYEIGWESPGYVLGGGFKTRLYDVTAGAAVELGTPISNEFGDRGQPGYSQGIARVTIVAANIYKIEYYTDSANTTDGLGRAANLDATAEIYTRVVIRKG